MKSLRKSLNSARESASRPQISTPVPLPAVSKPPSAILPPQKVIRALSSYRSQAPQELSFVKGDFFHVLKDVDDTGAWYEAHNPVSGARGLVPRSMFEEFGKSAAPSRISQAGPSIKSVGSPVISTTRSEPPPTPSGPRHQVFYAVVLHDFTAERADELDAKRGDPITVVAQSNREWFVAKPIGRLGRPGLIPVAFVEIHDPASGQAVVDIDALMDSGALPKVEDWKRAMLTYKANSIALGVIDAPAKPVENSPYSSQPPTMNSPQVDPRSDTPDALPEGILLSADVVSFHYEMEDYWFRIDAVFQPYNLSGARLPPSKTLILFRQYNDFYDFQVSLLDTFPREAGREPPEPRTLPYMPGPAQDVDDTLTATRRVELDDYVHSLCNLGKTGGRYILEHLVVRRFLALKPGDVENEGEPRIKEIQEIDALSNTDQISDDTYDRDDYDVRQQMDRLNIQERPVSNGSEYEDEGYAPSPQRKNYDKHPYHQGNQRHPDDNLRLHAHAQNHQRSGSSSSFNNTNSSYQSNSRSNSPLQRNGSPQPGRNGHNSNGHSRWNDNGYQPSDMTPSTESYRTSQASQSASSRSRSHSNAGNLNTPPISASNPQTAFVKIKIFDRVADDLIAIRVHPKVTHAELMDKVQARLGGEVGNLRYRDSMTNTFVGLDSDEELRAWMEGTDKHVLYAD
ncbi:Protein scd2/ral3 [Psilocybe cubensis]|uniref:Protein scd2/ral3 n=2 Tax=Psilocybe cubensis TaxID=181762 RepID=A0ACB8H425_PSICU|nr:Protein scd2/ral3 [Psilocybe cubensis]KAH9482475.1 Protein scd2/ral3 [Psilocybe cubensis]